MDILKKAIKDWQAEIEVKAAELIGAGMPPWDAMEEAKKHVSERRQRKSMQPADPGKGGER